MRFHAGIYGIPDEGTIEAMKCESPADRPGDPAGPDRENRTVADCSGRFDRFHYYRSSIRREINGRYDPTYQGRSD